MLETCDKEVEEVDLIDSKEVETACAILEDDRQKETRWIECLIPKQKQFQVKNFRDATDVLGLKVAPLQVPMARRLQVTDNINICLQEFSCGIFF